MLSLHNLINVTNLYQHVIFLLELDCLELNLNNDQIRVLQLSRRCIFAADILRLWLQVQL